MDILDHQVPHWHWQFF